MTKENKIVKESKSVTDRQTDQPNNGRTDGRTDGWMDKAG